MTLHTTVEGLKLAVLGEFDDDPNSDTLYDFADKFNFNMATLNQTVNYARSAYENMQQLAASGLLTGVTYGGELGVFPP